MLTCNLESLHSLTHALATIYLLKEKGKGEGYLYDCELLQLFELGSITNHYYLVNIRLPVNFLKGYNVGIGKVVDISIHVCKFSAAFCPILACHLYV